MFVVETRSRRIWIAVGVSKESERATRKADWAAVSLGRCLRQREKEGEEEEGTYLDMRSVSARS